MPRTSFPLACCVFTAALLACGGAHAGACLSDVDCGEKRSCEDGVCVDPNSASYEMTDAHATSRVNLHMNLLGAVQFGLSPAVEFGGRHFSFLLRIRPMNTGLLSYLLVPDLGSDEQFKSGIAGGAAFRIWPASHGGNMRGWYFGAATEAAYTVVKDEKTDMAQYSTAWAVPMGEAGYRWVRGGFILGFGGAAGAAIPVAAKDQPIGDHGCALPDSCQEKRSTRPYGHLSLELGFFL
jgi:hypothetical protein